jgi:hypothetical protein
MGIFNHKQKIISKNSPRSDGSFNLTTVVKMPLPFNGQSSPLKPNHLRKAMKVLLSIGLAFEKVIFMNKI